MTDAYIPANAGSVVGETHIITPEGDECPNCGRASLAATSTHVGNKFIEGPWECRHCGWIENAEEHHGGP